MVLPALLYLISTVAYSKFHELFSSSFCLVLLAASLLPKTWSAETWMAAKKREWMAKVWCFLYIPCHVPFSFLSFQVTFLLVFLFGSTPTIRSKPNSFPNLSIIHTTQINSYVTATIFNHRGTFRGSSCHEISRTHQWIPHSCNVPRLEQTWHDSSHFFLFFSISSFGLLFLF